MDNIKLPSNRNFGIVFFLFFLIVSLWPLLNNDEIRFWSLFIALFFLFFGILNSKILTPLNKLWLKFGIILGRVVSPIIMGIIFFFVVTPISLIMKLFSKDILNLKKNSSNTYWIERNKVKSNMKKQF